MSLVGIHENTTTTAKSRLVSPTVTARNTIDSNSSNNSRKRRRRNCVVVLLLAVTAALVIAVATVSSFSSNKAATTLNNNNKGSSSSSSSSFWLPFLLFSSSRSLQQQQQQQDIDGFNLNNNNNMNSIHVGLDDNHDYYAQGMPLLKSSSSSSSSHSYSTYVGYHKRVNPNKNYTSALTGNKGTLAGPVSYWRAAQLQKQYRKRISNSNYSSYNESGSSTSSQQHYNVYMETTGLSDVLFYLAMALTWFVWLLKTFVKTDFLRYSQDSRLVRGHVLQVTRDDNAEGNGIPTYKAVVDYFIGDDEDDRMQVRKEFETQTYLEQGFGNVELLVLRDEPTSSVLKEDWQNQFEEMQDARSKQRDGTWCQRNVCWTLRSTHLWKRIWVLFLGTLVLASLAGSVVSARYLPPGKKTVGWCLVAIGVIGLVPAAIGLRMGLTLLERYFQVRNGIILQHHKLDSNGNKSRDYCDPFAVLDTSACDESEAFSLAHSRQIEMSSTSAAQKVDETAACYVIRMVPPGMTRENNSNISDLSSVSLKHQHSQRSAASSSTTGAAAGVANEECGSPNHGSINPRWLHFS